MRSYIVVVSPSYGGAEKRFFDIFRSLRSEGSDVVMIAPSSLVQRLVADHAEQPELASAMIAIELPVWSRKAFIGGFRRLLSTLPRGSNFHYPMNCLWPLHVGRGDRVAMSVTNCVNVPGPSAGNHTGLWSWLSFFFVDQIDVLSPAILAQMGGYRMARKMSLTPGGTFLEAPARSSQQRQPTVVLLSRLIAKKGIDDLLDVLPQVWAALRERAPAGFGFEIAGYGALQEHLVGRIQALARDGVPVSFVGYADATVLLSRSAVALSMQEVTNYPSRVVAEALVSGCGVIVRNTGDSMEFGENVHGLFYCNAQLDAAQLSVLIATLVDRVIGDDHYSELITATAIEKFCSKSTVNYFRHLLGLKRDEQGVDGAS